MKTVNLLQEIDDWLPQTQCAACGYPRCLDYAEAIAKNEAGINRCPPGNEVTIAGLAALLDLPVTNLDPDVGPHLPRQVYYIDESRCIGCTLCIKACPVDAIIGSGKQMHSILETECTGCDLCVPPCPMDCILSKPYAATQDSNSPWSEYPATDTKKFRARINRRLERLARESSNQKQEQQKASASLDSARIKAEINDAIKRVQEKKNNQESQDKSKP